MTDFLLICIGIAQMVQIIVTILLLRSIDKPDFSQEDREVKHAQREIDEARRKIPPQT